MTTSEARVFVWSWLPGAVEPVVTGAVDRVGGSAPSFTYGRSYLERSDALALFGLPLRRGAQVSEVPGQPPGALRDALPDAWGQHVIAARAGLADLGDLDLHAMMLGSGSDRFGAVDFQGSATHYVPRGEQAPLEELVEAAELLSQGRALSEELDQALVHGTSVGGARPKATLVDGDSSLIAKMSRHAETDPVIRHEALGQRLASACGVDAVVGEIVTALGRDVLLVPRFDRGAGRSRRHTVSALSILRLAEHAARYASYVHLLEELARCAPPDADVAATAREMFTRVAVNIAVGNTDDHARNHAALWDGQHLALTPAYDIEPCRGAGWEANQAMAYGPAGERASNLAALARAAGAYGMSRPVARELVERVVATVTARYDELADQVGLTREQAGRLRGTRVLNPGILDGWGRPIG